MYSWVKIDISELPLANLTGGALKVWLALAWNMQEDFYSTCSYERLRASLRLSKRTVIRAIKELDQNDVITKCNESGSCLRVFMKRGVAIGKNNPPPKDIRNPGNFFKFPDPEDAKREARMMDNDKRRDRAARKEQYSRGG